MILNSRWAVVALLTLGLHGCATIQAPTEDEQEPGRLISSDEIMKTGASSAWDAIKVTVRFATFSENWDGEADRIRTRGQSSLAMREDMRIYVDGIKVINLVDLQLMPATDIAHMRVMNGIDGTTKYGTGNVDGVILITTKSYATNRY
jgi:hypothetical protein